MDSLWKYNIPFKDVPDKLAGRVWSLWDEKRLPPEKLQSLNSGMWNMACFLNGEMIVFVWGQIDPLLEELFVKGIVCDKEVESYQDRILRLAEKGLRDAKERFDIKHIYFLNWRMATLLRRNRKKPSIKIYPTAIVEVL